MFNDFFKVLGKKKKKTVSTKGFVQISSDGLFFSNLDEAYINSTTATMALLKFNEYCVLDLLIPKFQKLWNKVRNDYIRYGYYLMLVSYDIDGNANGWDYLNPKNFLVKDSDDNDNASTFINIKSGKVYPTFNSNKIVVKSQFVKDGYEKFSGQIFMYNDSSLPYRITPLFSALKWMRTEADASTYIEKACDNAMFGNSIFVMKKSSSSTEKEMEVIESVRESISSVKGVEETAQNLFIEYEGDIDDTTKLLSKISISNDINVDLLNAADDKASEKICISCYGFPQILVKQSEGIFGNSGEAITVATNEWSKTCKKEANNILDGFIEIGFKITTDAEPIIQPDSPTA